MGHLAKKTRRRPISISIYYIISEKSIKMHTSYYLSYIFAAIYQII